MLTLQIDCISIIDVWPLLLARLSALFKLGCFINFKSEHCKIELDCQRLLATVANSYNSQLNRAAVNLKCLHTF
jgi:hypothetical protein